MFRVEALFGESDKQLVRLDDGSEHYIEGELDGWLIVSVPETTSPNAANRVKQALETATNRPVLIVTHNIHFLKLGRLSATEAGRVIRTAEGNLIALKEAQYAQEEDLEESAAAARIAEERARLISGDGDRSGSDLDGAGDFGSDVDRQASGEHDPDDPDPRDSGEAEEGSEDEGEHG